MPASVAARVWYWRRTFAEALDGSGMRRQLRGENNNTNVAEANQTQHNTSQQRQTRNQQRRSRGSFRANRVSGQAMRRDGAPNRNANGLVSNRIEVSPTVRN
mmetsp:Transcript_7854/g.17545  ORF Transcript_7854/g.17545 Transcript_7854/m.17545 type:complete len:102 (+) Transcript_7854:65-370(+)